MAQKAEGKSQKKSRIVSVYQLKVTLKGISPPIWRRFQVTDDITLPKFHRVLQAIMGWEDYHLHVFDIGGVSYSMPYYPGEVDLDEMGMTSEKRVKLSKLALAEKSRFLYEYDLGDSWIHEILVEKILPPDPEVKYPICIAGERSAPPEDCGGVWDYEEFVEAISNPDHPEHEEYLDWVGGNFDPEKFDLEAINRELGRMK
ncbi:MAG: hypothetical protein APR56_13000 [Methanosaeta sp. SDB]|jgi:hypothetical protein|uniref:Plasmid pRiA4b Orf3-like domain-containing protein n=1 Tax=Methanothrix harundinacea TaxID=301375 RepID=A0A101IKP1_9EURY|nr:MAG: hypothetical protein APR56_13000 [Methanosaeta sp. SDB]KUK45309.1 MAG: hypothetical protein XD72_0337 [Methanothrix harundinacea]KUK96936.1 MAG: hypothetical protein XE07_0708 [Methanothrix harundinacea]